MPNNWNQHQISDNIFGILAVSIYCSNKRLLYDILVQHTWWRQRCAVCRQSQTHWLHDAVLPVTYQGQRGRGSRSSDPSSCQGDPWDQCKFKDIITTRSPPFPPTPNSLITAWLNWGLWVLKSQNKLNKKVVYLLQVASWQTTYTHFCHRPWKVGPQPSQPNYAPTVTN